jgi:hypothetical protein
MFLHAWLVIAPWVLSPSKAGQVFFCPCPQQGWLCLARVVHDQQRQTQCVTAMGHCVPPSQWTPRWDPYRTPASTLACQKHFPQEFPKYLALKMGKMLFSIISWLYSWEKKLLQPREPKARPHLCGSSDLPNCRTSNLCKGSSPSSS